MTRPMSVRPHLLFTPRRQAEFVSSYGTDGDGRRRCSNRLLDEIERILIWSAHRMAALLAKALVPRRYYFDRLKEIWMDDREKSARYFLTFHCRQTYIQNIVVEIIENKKVA
jgi:hypothetical protein